MQGTHTLFWTNCYGVYKFANGGRYEGDFQQGKFHGNGLLVFESGGKYSGEFKKNHFDGKGNYTSASDNKYVGYFRKNRFHGNGTETWANGDKYLGNFHNGTAHGEGTYIWQNGNKYEGGYENGKFHGNGTFIIGNRQYTGNWQQNILMGKMGLRFHKKMKYHDTKNKNFHRWALGELFFKGLRIPVDREKGLKWYRVAADSGYEKAKKTLKNIRSQLEPKAIAKCMFVNVKKISGPETKEIVLDYCRSFVRQYSLEQLVLQDNNRS